MPPRLLNQWKFWLVVFTHGPSSKMEWNLEEIVAFASLDVFFREYSRLPPPSELKDLNGRRPSIACFKDETKPAWEDPRNKDGGAFIFLTTGEEVDGVWRDLLFYVVGGTLKGGEGECLFLEKGNEINGIIVGPKKGNHEWKIEIWTSGTAVDVQKLQEWLVSEKFPSHPSKVAGLTFKAHSEPAPQRGGGGSSGGAREAHAPS
jgi:hypothetical protein